MGDPNVSAKRSPFSLWGLTLEAETAPHQPPMKQTFIVRLGQEAGVLTFASALDAEIYCQHLAASGVGRWQRERLERIDLSGVLAAIPEQQQRLMLSLGYYASESNDLLADDSQSLVTPLLPVQFDTHPTRQVATGNGGIVWVSGGGSFSVKNDLRLGFARKRGFLRFAENRFRVMRDRGPRLSWQRSNASPRRLLKQRTYNIYRL